MTRQFVPPERIVKLIDTGKYQTDLDVIEQIHTSFREVSGSIYSDDATNSASRYDPDYAMAVIGSVPMLLDQAIKEIEHYYIHHESDPDESYRVEIRVSANTIIKIGKATRDVVIPGISLILAVMMSTSFSALFLLWVGLSIYDLMQKLYGAWEVLQDADERLIFEAIFKLHGKCCDTNYDAISNHSFDEAYHLVSPTEEDIVNEIGASRLTRDVHATLVGLEQRSVLNQRGSRWSIRV